MTAMRDWRPWLIFVIAAPVYGAVAAQWLQLNRITGDEPHYLIAAHALAYDASLDVKPVYGHGPWAEFGVPEPPHVAAIGASLISTHGLALPVLLALPYRLAGVLGAKLMLCIATALLVARFPSILARMTGERTWSLAVAATLALSLPYTMAAGQIYPDLLTGLICVWLIDDLAIGFAGAGSSAWRMLRYALMAGALPWLHQRHVLIAVIFATAFALRVAHDRGYGRQASRGLRTSTAVLALVLLFALVALNVAFISRLLGAQLGAQLPAFLGWYSVMIVTGLHLDQVNGLFFQNPVLFGGLLGLPRFARSAPLLTLLWIIVCAALLFPVAAFTIGYGGWAPAGRYGWDVAPLWILPLGAFVGWVLRQRGGRAVLATLLIAALLLQAAFAERWVRVFEFLLPGDRNQALWTHNSLFGRLRYFLPHFRSPERMFTWAPNWVWMIFAFACVALGTRLRGALRPPLFAAAALAVGAAAVLLTWPRTYDAVTLAGVELGGEVGKIEASGRAAHETVDPQGYLFVGPYLSLDPGCYRVTVAYDAETPAATPPTWDVIVFHPGPANLVQIEKGVLASSGAHQLQHGFAVQPGNHVEGLQFRVRYPGKGVVRVNQVTFEAAVPCE